MPPRKSADWRGIIKEIAVGICLVMTTWGAIMGYRAEGTATDAKRNADKLQGTVNEIKVQADESTIDAKKAMAIALSNVAITTNKPEDVQRAKEAWDDYTESLIESARNTP